MKIISEGDGFDDDEAQENEDLNETIIHKKQWFIIEKKHVNHNDTSGALYLTNKYWELEILREHT